MSEAQTESRMDNIDVLCNDHVRVQQNHATEEMAGASREIGTTMPEAETMDQTGSELSRESETVASNLPRKTELKIDPRFRSLIQPLTAGELAALTEDILIHGCRDPLVVWKGQNIILDGHHRYEICQKHGIDYQVVELDFPNETETKIWMIKNQRGRRNLNESQRAMLQ